MRSAFVLSAVLSLLWAIVPAQGADQRQACFEATMVQDHGLKSIAVCDALIKTGRLTGRDLATALNNRGLGYMKQNKLDLAMSDFDRAIRSNPLDVFAYDNRGDVWRKRGDHDRALKEYNEAIRIDPNFLSAYLDRAQTYQTMGNKRSARADYQSVLKIKGLGRAIDKWAKDEARRLLAELDKGN